MKTLSMAKSGHYTIKWMLSLPYQVIEELGKINIAEGKNVHVISNDGFHVIVKNGDTRYVLDNDLCACIRI